MTKKQYQTYCRIEADWWIVYSTTGACKNRNISKGLNGPQLTDDEKVEEAMQTARTHMKNYWDSCNGINNQSS